MALRIGFVGCGRIARSHSAEFEKLNTKITAVADIVPEAAEKFAEETGARAFADTEAMLASGLVDAVTVCVTPKAHEEVTVACAKHGVHVMCEKPLAHSVASARRMCEACDEAGVLFMCALPFRMRSGTAKLKSLVADGAIGAPVFYHSTLFGPTFWVKDAWYTKKEIAGAGILLDLGAHMIGAFREVIGEVVDQKALAHRHLEGTDVEDAAMVLLKGENGTIASLSMGWVAGVGQHYVNIVGQEGRLYHEYGSADTIQLFRKNATEPDIFNVTHSHGFPEQASHFVDAVNKKVELRSTGWDALRDMEIIEACYASYGETL